MALKHQFLTERELRVQAENDCNRLRNQLADALAASHRDTLNLKKALTDMQKTNHQSLATVYEKGDQNLELMQQLEDLAKIIRDKEAENADLNSRIRDLED